jgi:hypothetical protein
MPRKAIRDSIAIDATSGVEIRRGIFAGQMVPDEWDADPADVQDAVEANSAYGVVVAAPAHKSVERPPIRMTVEEMRSEVARRGIEIEGGVEHARRAALLDALKED